MQKKNTYTIVVPNDISETNLTYTVSNGATVKLGNDEMISNDGIYTLPLTTRNQTITVISADGKITNSYSFKLQKKLFGYPDKVVDFICINSRYTNGIEFENAASPWVSLSGSYTSIGNFGGYITYYYDEPIKDNPNNKYGIDFYVYGNANKDTSSSSKTSFFEPAQAWVSEDGTNWYALAGSAHYDDDVLWDYKVTYSKTVGGKTAWQDNLGNRNDGASCSGQWPSTDIYNMNSLSDMDTVTLSGILLPSSNGEIAPTGKAVNAYPVKWGYADCFVNGIKGADVNPYADNTNFDLMTNGFDLKWAVDKDGMPVDVSDKEFHYVKLVTTSNIWHSSYGEKSPEIAGVLKTTPQNDSVGKTISPKSITLSDGVDTKIVNISDDKKVYSVDVGDMKYVSVSLDGASPDDNIYVNNTRILHNEKASGFKVTKESGEKLVRVVVQNGVKEPCIYLLKIRGTAEGANDLIEDIKLNVNGQSLKAESNNQSTYSASVGYKIDYVGICPVADSSVYLTVNGEPIKDKYTLTSGKNIFNVSGEKDGKTYNVTLVVFKESAPVSSSKITVYFTLLGDDKHGEGGARHTLKDKNLDTWISKTEIEVNSPATVLGVLEKALEGKYTFINTDGNYISKINSLAELDNGLYSGWIYTLNDKYTNKGVSEQIVKNGDRIVFHYTDDYTAEQSSKSSGGKSYSTKQDNDKEDNKDKDRDTQNEKTFSEEIFKDVKKNQWYYESVKYVYEKNLMQGTDNGFEPDRKMTRAILVTVLYRLANPKKVESNLNFKDVAHGEWYTDAIAWAAANGIANGISETEFSPNDIVNREQMATIIYRYAKIKGYDIVQSSETQQFVDKDEVSDWATHAIEWASKAELVKGTSDTVLSPKDTATRAQVATILMRFLEKVKL